MGSRGYYGNSRIFTEEGRTLHHKRSNGLDSPALDSVCARVRILRGNRDWQLRFLLQFLVDEKV